MTKKRIKTKHEVMQSETFKTRKVFSFDSGEEDGVAVLVAYQLGSEGRHRIALVNDEGRTIVASARTPNQFPCMAEFGMQRFVAVSAYFAGDCMTDEYVYRLEAGLQTSLTRSIEKQEPEIEKEASPWEGWFIEECDCTGRDLLEVRVRMRHTNGEVKTIEETLDAPFDDVEGIGCANYGGHGKNQQAILITVTDADYDAGEQDIQLEIDYKTGEFLPEKYGEWSAA